jgi:hypothetical protein
VSPERAVIEVPEGGEKKHVALVTQSVRRLPQCLGQLKAGADPRPRVRALLFGQIVARVGRFVLALLTLLGGDPFRFLPHAQEVATP